MTKKKTKLVRQWISLPARMALRKRAKAEGRTITKVLDLLLGV